MSARPKNDHSSDLSSTNMRLIPFKFTAYARSNRMRLSKDTNREETATAPRIPQFIPLVARNARRHVCSQHNLHQLAAASIHTKNSTNHIKSVVLLFSSSFCSVSLPSPTQRGVVDADESKCDQQKRSSERTRIISFGKRMKWNRRTNDGMRRLITIIIGSEQISCFFLFLVFSSILAKRMGKSPPPQRQQQQYGPL